MNFLLDTNVISEFVRDTPHPSVINWLDEHRGDVVLLSVVTIGEIQQGIDRLPESTKREQLASWLNDTLLVSYEDRILPIDTWTMLQWGTLTAQLIRQGRKMPVMDTLLAATALQHNLSLVTRNVQDFSEAGIDLINPWE